MFLPDANNFTGKVTMPEIFNCYGISPTCLFKLRDRALEAIKVAGQVKKMTPSTQAGPSTELLQALENIFAAKCPI
jgi:hypothetical protein